MPLPEQPASASDLEEQIVLPNRPVCSYPSPTTVRRGYGSRNSTTTSALGRGISDSFQKCRRCPTIVVRMLACVDYRRQLALVAEHDNGNGLEIVGLASFGAINDGNVKVALVIRDDWQRQRLGTELARQVTAGC